MRMLGATCLAAATLVGCNQLYGLEETTVDDPEVPPGVVRVSLRHVGTDATGAPTAPQNGPLDDLIAVSYGPLGQPLDGDDPPLVEPVTELSIPGEIHRVPWRLVLIRAGQLEHEYQFAARLEGIHVIVPRYSRTERRPVVDTDAGTAIAARPTGYLLAYQSAHEHHRMYTTGVWSATDVNVNGQFQLFFDCPAGTSCTRPSYLDGPGIPETARGDRYVAIDLDNVDADGECRSSVGVADFTVDVTEGQIARPMPEPSWLTEPSVAADLQGIDEFISNVVSLPSEGGQRFRYRYGYTPSDALPAFSHVPARGFTLAGPPMLEVLECGLGFSGVRFVPSSELNESFPTTVHAEIVALHARAGAPTLTNGLALVLPSVTGVARLEELAPLATGFQLGAVALETGRARVEVGRDQLHTLTFTRSAAADYYDVILHEIRATEIHPRRVYTVANMPPGELPIEMEPVAIDLHAAPLTPGGEYVFEVRSYTGRRTARAANFQDAAARQSMAVIHSATFVVGN